MRLHAPGTCAGCGPDAVAVDAHDLALGQFAHQPALRRALIHQFPDIPELLSDVVKFQDQGVPLPTIRTMPRPQILVDERSCRTSAPDARCSNLSPMQVAASLKICPEAIATPRLPAITVPVEAVERQSASAA